MSDDQQSKLIDQLTEQNKDLTAELKSVKEELAKEKMLRINADMELLTLKYDGTLKDKSGSQDSNEKLALEEEFKDVSDSQETNRILANNESVETIEH